MGEAGSALEMGRLEAPVRDKPGIDQHQRRALHQDVRKVGSVIKKCSTAGRSRVTKRRLNRSAGSGVPRSLWKFDCFEAANSD